MAHFVKVWFCDDLARYYASRGGDVRSADLAAGTPREPDRRDGCATLALKRRARGIQRYNPEARRGAALMLGSAT